MPEVKVTKRDIQAAKRPDAVLANAATLFDWLYERRNPLLTGFAGVLVAIGIVSWVRSSSTAKAEVLGGELAKAADLSSWPVVETPAENQEADAKVDSFPSAEEKTKAVNAALAALVEKDPGTGAAASAALDLAQVRYSEGKYDEAISLAQKYIDKQDGTGLNLFAYETIGDAYAAKKDYAKADDAFKKIAEAGSPAVALFHQAELAEEQGKKDEARSLYEKIGKEYEKDSVASAARIRLDLLDVPPAGQGALTLPVEATEPATPAALPGKGAPGKVVPGKGKAPAGHVVMVPAKKPAP